MFTDAASGGQILSRWAHRTPGTVQPLPADHWQMARVSVIYNCLQKREYETVDLKKLPYQVTARCSLPCLPQSGSLVLGIEDTEQSSAGPIFFSTRPSVMPHC